MRVRNVFSVLLVAVAAACASAPASPTADLDEARRLAVDARPHVERANDVAAPMEERLTHRREAYAMLLDSKKKYDSYLAKNPAEESKLDKEYTDVCSLIYWVKKDSRSGGEQK